MPPGSGSLFSHVYSVPTGVVEPLSASMANGSEVSGCVSLSSSGSSRLDVQSESQSGGMSAAFSGSVPLAFSSALV